MPRSAGAPSEPGWPRGAKRRLLCWCEDAILIDAIGGKTERLECLNKVELMLLLLTRLECNVRIYICNGLTREVRMSGCCMWSMTLVSTSSGVGREFFHKFAYEFVRINKEHVASIGGYWTVKIIL